MKKLSFHYSADFFRSLSLFRDISDQFLDFVVEIQDLYSFESNEKIDLELHPESRLMEIWILAHGKANAHLIDSSGVSFTKELVRGEAFCNFYEITGTESYWRIECLRPSLFIKLSVEQKRAFIYPEYGQLISRMVKKSLLKLAGQRSRDEIRRIAIVPAHPPQTFDIGKWIKGVTQLFEKLGRTLLFTPDTACSVLQTDLQREGDLTTDELLFRLMNVEKNYDYSLYLLDSFDKEWIEFCVKSADRILFVANGDEPVLVGNIAQHCMQLAKDNADLGPRHLALIYGKGFQGKNSFLMEWKQILSTSREYHVVDNSKAELSRLIRIFLEKSVGLVLGSGAGRGLTQIGVYRALCEAGIPVDVVCGTSIGAMIGVMIAQRNSWQECRDLAKSYIAKMNSCLLDFPVLSMVSEKSQMDIAEALLGSQKIEDLPINFFCVTLNLYNTEIVLHQYGAAKKAVFASSALPGLFPPVEEENALLVDGGVMEPIPVGPMISLYSPAFMIAVDVSCEVEMRFDTKEPEAPSDNLWGYFFDQEAKPQLTILDIVLRMCELNATKSRHRIMERKMADVLLRPDISGISLVPNSDEVDAIIERSYRQFSSEAPKWLAAMKEKIPLFE